MANDVDKVLYIAVIITLILIVGFVVLVKNKPKKDALDVTAAVIGLIFLIPLAVSVYSVVLQQNMFKIWSNRQLVGSVDDVDKNYEKLLNNKESLRRLRRQILNLDYTPEDVDNDVILSEKAFTMSLFQSMQNFYFVFISESRSALEEYKDLPGFFNLTRDWFKSPLIREYWKDQKSYFAGKNFITFVEKEIIFS